MKVKSEEEMKGDKEMKVKSEEGMKGDKKMKKIKNKDREGR